MRLACYGAVMASADLLLHPVRLRIVQAFLGDRALTTGALAAELADVPPATLYRQVARLVDAGVLQVAAEQLVRGAVQRTYVLRASAAVITADQIAAMSAEDLRQSFLAFVAGLLGDVDRYLARDGVDPVRDGASFRLAGLWLDDAEFATLLRDLMRVLQPAAANPPRPGRKRRVLATVLLPGDEPVGDQQDRDPAAATADGVEQAPRAQPTAKSTRRKRRTT
jgi:Helix-turn-helix domain